MKFNLKKFVISLGCALDLVEIDVLGGPSNHSKRVAYIASCIAKVLGLSNEEVTDIVSLSILHDNGAYKFDLFHTLTQNSKAMRICELENNKEHCINGEEIVMYFPFINDVTDIIRFHHEKYDGSGFFGLKGENIPFLSQIIGLADNIDIVFNLKNVTIQEREDIVKHVVEKSGILYSPKVVDAFIEVVRNVSFWLDLKDEFINSAINRTTPNYYRDLSWEQIRYFTGVFSSIIDSKSTFTQRHSSGLAQKVLQMSEYYNKDAEEINKLVIAAHLHDIGKLAISNSIIDKPDKLTQHEIKVVQSHTYYTRTSLEQIEGFEDITEWASNHHEKLDGSGYPYGHRALKIDFNSRLMACLDIYQALLEERPYRKGLSHQEGMQILEKMASQNVLDKQIVCDIDKVLRE